MSRNRKTAGARDAVRAMAGVLSVIAALGLSAPGHAADYPDRAPVGGEDPFEGVACSIGLPIWEPQGVTAETLPWRSVYYGHFSGGRPYRGPDGRVLVDWRDEHVCFPSRAKCRAWISHLRYVYDRPEGYWACVFLR
ncbi:MAG: hypothetical protein WDN46_08850 [Methylocella sp.]